MRAPSLPQLLIGHWQPSVALTGTAGLAAVVYLAAPRHAAHGWPMWRTFAFLAGIACLLVALESGLGAFDDRLLSAHMAQHLLLLEVAPALLLCGRPVGLALRTVPSRERRLLARGLVRLRPFTQPWMCLTAFSAVVLLAHVPVIFDAAVQHPLVHVGEHVCFLAVGLLLWWPLVGEEPGHRRLGGLAQFVYLIVAMLPMTVIGAYLDRDPSVFYPAYRVATLALRASPVIDQQQAGAIMWVAGTTMMIVVGLWSSLNAMVAAERRQQRRERYEAGIAGERTR